MSKAKAWLVKTGLDYEVDGEPKRAIPGDVVTDLPVKSIPWLSDQGHIEEATPAKGGPVAAGRTYIVGERQHEVFIPHRNGRIEGDD